MQEAIHGINHLVLGGSNAYLARLWAPKTPAGVDIYAILFIVLFACSRRNISFAYRRADGDLTKLGWSVASGSSVAETALGRGNITC